MAKKKTFEDMLDKGLDEWDDEEVLTYFASFLDRVNVGNQLVKNDDGLYVGQVLVVVSGDKMFTSSMQPFDWPLQPAPLPEGASVN